MQGLQHTIKYIQHLFFKRKNVAVQQTVQGFARLDDILISVANPADQHFSEAA